MKTKFIKCYQLVPASAIILICNNVFAQVPTLEFASGAGPAGKGPSIAPQVVTFQNNINNPAGNTFAAYLPTTTVTFSLSNQQFAIPVAESSTAAAMNFGAGNTNATAAITPYYYYNLMNNYSSSVNGNYTSASAVPAGTGIAINKNYGLQLFTSAMGLYHAEASTSDRYYIADLTIKFNRKVSNPVLHLTGLGATFGGLGFTTELELQTPSVTLSELSGSTELTVSDGTKILNNAINPGGTTGSGAASGSVLVAGTNITSLTFKIFLRGDGGGDSWSSGDHIGDGWLLAVSVPTDLIVLPIKITQFTAAPMDTYAQLRWDSEIENNSCFFNVESSTDGSVWKNIGRVMPEGNGNAVKTYRFTDVNAAAGVNYYRIQEVDAQGHTVCSLIRSVDLGGNFHTSIFPNPVKDKLHISGNDSSIQSIIISNTDGKEMYHCNNLPSGNNLDMSPLPIGIYFVTIRYASGHAQTMKVVKE